MKIRGFAEPGQIRCYECGEQFVVDRVGAHCAVTVCPNGHNRGSWIEFERVGTYSIPVEMDVSALRRKFEDRIRKDPVALIKALQAVDGVSSLPVSAVLDAMTLLHSGCNCMQCQHGDDPCDGNLEALTEAERSKLTVSFRDGKVDAIY
jgi:hypothetical protein